MKAGRRTLGLTALGTAVLAAPASAHPAHGFHVSGWLHSLLHALDATGILLVGLTLIVVAAVVRVSLHRGRNQQA